MLITKSSLHVARQILQVIDYLHKCGIILVDSLSEKLWFLFEEDVYLDTAHCSLDASRMYARNYLKPSKE